MLALKHSEKVVSYSLYNIQQQGKQVSLCLEKQQIKIIGKASGQSAAIK